MNGFDINTETSDPNSWQKWALFCAFLLTVPVPYYMIVVGGLVPAFSIIFITVKGTIVALPKFTKEGFYMLGILWAHVIIYCVIFYIVALLIKWALNFLFPPIFVKLSIVLFNIGLFVGSTFEIYRIPGHNSAPPANLITLIYRL